MPPLPTLLPFFFHWYDGDVPPLVGVAVKVTDEPEQMVEPGFAAMLTDGVLLPTFMVMLLLVAVVTARQVALLVIVQDITSLLFRLLSV